MRHCGRSDRSSVYLVLLAVLVFPLLVAMSSPATAVATHRAASFPVGAPPAASVAAGPPALAPCAGKSVGFVLRTYRRGASRLVLRCGSTTWGYRHVTRRWSPAFDAKIALTLARGAVVTDYQQDGGSAIYALFDARCRELFRVIYNAGAYRGVAVRPQGVVTAYARPTLVMASVAPDPGVATTGTRCRIVQDI